MLFPTKISSNITQGLQHFFLFSVIATEYLYNDFPKGGKFTVNPLQWHILFDRSPLCTTLYQYYRENFHAILFFHPTQLLILGFFPRNTIIPYHTFIFLEANVHPIRLFHTLRLLDTLEYSYYSLHFFNHPPTLIG